MGTELQYNSLKYVMDKYSKLLKREAGMKANAENDKLYYQLQEMLNNELREFLRLNFSYLNTKQLLKLCAMVSSYRPVAPHSFLITCSQLIK